MECAVSDLTKTRLDLLLVNQGLYPTRSRARDAVMRSCIKVDGQAVSKPGSLTRNSALIEITDEALNYVSRAALKLKHGLQISGFDPGDKICLDIGASTGGFSQLLLEHGARLVFALDVGERQLNSRIREDPRLHELSNLNARDLTVGHLNNLLPQFLVADVSFISLKLALPPALQLAQPGAKGIFLIKPQFEVGRQNIGKGGIVCDVETGARAANSICRWLNNQSGWQVSKLADSPIEGNDGNREYIVVAEKLEHI